LPADELLKNLQAARVFDLEQPRYFGAPTHPGHLPGFNYFLHRRHEKTDQPRTSASGMIVMPEHTGTHIDALSHQAENMVLHGGVKVDGKLQTAAGFKQLGIDTMPPLIGRGVLLDVAGKKGLAPEHLISADELQAGAKAAGVEVAEGDVVLVRTGFGRIWDKPDEYLKAAGVGSSGSRWLAERKVKAVGADNMAFDSLADFDRELGVNLPAHLLLLARAGIPIIENLNLEELAQAGVHEFVFVCLPLKMRGVTGSPVRPLALA
jgi:kynurenine formamidase